MSRRVTKELSLDQWQTVIAGLAEMQFWQMATHGNSAGAGGAQWLVEARRNGRYHVVDRGNAADGLDSVGRLFLDLAGLFDVGSVY